MARDRVANFWDQPVTVVGSDRHNPKENDNLRNERSPVRRKDQATQIKSETIVCAVRSCDYEASDRPAKKIPMLRRFRHSQMHRSEQLRNHSHWRKPLPMAKCLQSICKAAQIGSREACRPYNLEHGGGRGPVAPPVFKTGLAGIAFAGGFDSLPPPPIKPLISLRF